MTTVKRRYTVTRYDVSRFTVWLTEAEVMDYRDRGFTVNRGA